MNQNSKIDKVIVSSSSSARKNLIDNNRATCWISSHKKEQQITLVFELYVKTLKVTFQSGFHPKKVRLVSSNFESDFEMTPNESSKIISIEKHIQNLRIDFFESYDFYNRICVYAIELF